MIKVPAYIINMENCSDRKQYMSDLMSMCPYFESHFIAAVNGKEMKGSEIDDMFDQNGAFLTYGRVLRAGEIGCTLSHFKCAGALLESTAQYALVLEDDLVLQDMDLIDLIEKLDRRLKVNDPVIISLSGDYWFSSRERLNEKYSLAKVVEAVCAQAYLLNRAAAQKMLDMGRAHLADDWYKIRHSGISVYAVYPHIADQNRLDFGTEISPLYTGYIRKNLKLPARIRSYVRAVVKRMLKYAGHFESKNFKW